MAITPRFTGLVPIETHVSRRFGVNASQPDASRGSGRSSAISRGVWPNRFFRMAASAMYKATLQNRRVQKINPTATQKYVCAKCQSDKNVSRPVRRFGLFVRWRGFERGKVLKTVGVAAAGDRRLSGTMATQKRTLLACKSCRLAQAAVSWLC